MQPAKLVSARRRQRSEEAAELCGADGRLFEEQVHY